MLILFIIRMIHIGIQKLFYWLLSLIISIFNSINFKDDNEDNDINDEINDPVVQVNEFIVPCVKSWPVIGNLFDFIKSGGGSRLHYYIDERHREYGPIFRERLAVAFDGIFVSSADLIRNVFLVEGKYPQHPLPTSWLVYNKTYNCQRGLFFMDGQNWYHNRRVLNRFLLNGNLNWMYQHIQNVTKRLIYKWQDSCNLNGHYFIENLEQQLYHWSIHVIISVMFDDDYIDEPDMENAIMEFANMVHKIFESSAILMDLPISFAKFFNLQQWKNFKNSVDQVLEKAYHIIDIYIKKNLTDNCGLYRKLTEADVQNNLIRLLFVDLVIAAADTTTYSTTWALYLLSQNNEIQDKIIDEYNAYYYNTYLKDYNTPIVRGLIKETLRLYPVAPFIGRYMPCDASLKGYQLKKNDLLLISLYTSGRSPKHFPDPLEVKPERWFHNLETGTYAGVYEPHATIPFAMGGRSCIGRKLAMAQMQCFITEITKLFHVQCLNTERIESILRMVTVPNQPLKLNLTLRHS